jgi:DNA repair protein RecO (recombination protein O)
MLLAKGRDLDIITQVETVNAYRPIREDLLRGAYAAYTVELLDKFTPDEQENAELYALLRAALGWVSESADLALTARYYELQLLSLSGFQPQLHACVLGGEKLTAADQFFSAENGGGVCPACGAARPELLRLSLNALKLLRYLQTRPYSAVVALQVRPATLLECEHLLQTYLTHLLERQLKSVEFIKRLRREAAQSGRV